MSFRVVGLDPSVTSFGVAEVGSDGVVGPTLALRPKVKGAERLLWFRGKLDLVAVKYTSEDLAVLEGYSYGSRNLSYAGEVVGITKLAFYEVGVPMIVVPPATLKKFVTGSGNAKKDEMRLEVYKRFGFEAKSQDEVEAVALALFGLHWVGAGEGNEDGEIPLMVPKAHLLSLAKAEVLW